MTLFEALGSGRRFKRGPSGAWLTTRDSFSLEQILDQGWELEGEITTITKEQLNAAIIKAIPGATDHQIYAFFKELCL